MENYLDIDETVSRIAGLVKKAESILEPKLKTVNTIVAAVKEGLSRGVDTILTSQAKEWLVALAVASTDLTPQREAFELTRSLWKIETAKIAAQRLQAKSSEQKKVDIANDSVILLSDFEVHQSVVEYMSRMLKETKENITQLIQTLKRIVDARIEEETDARFS
jgi:hypothetical protein